MSSYVGLMPFLFVGWVLAWVSPLGRHGDYLLVAFTVSACWWLLTLHATARRFYLGLWRTPPLPVALALALVSWPAAALLSRWFAEGGWPRALLIAGAVLFGLWGRIEVPVALVVLSAFLAPDRALFRTVALPALGALGVELWFSATLEDWLPPRIQRAIRAGRRRRARGWAVSMLPLTPFVSAEAREEIYLYVSTTYWTTGAPKAAAWWARRTVPGPRRRGNVEAHLTALHNVAIDERSAARYERAVAALTKAREITEGRYRHYLVKAGGLGPDAARIRADLHAADLAKDFARVLRDQGDLSRAVAETDHGLALVGTQQPPSGLLGEPIDPATRQSLQALYLELMLTRAQLAGGYLHDERQAERLLLAAEAAVAGFDNAEVAASAAHFLNIHYGGLLLREQRYEEAEQRFRAARAAKFQLARAGGLTAMGSGGDPAAGVTASLANLARVRGDHDAAEPLYREVLATASARRADPGFSCMVLVGLSDVLAAKGELTEALRWAREAVELADGLQSEMMLRNSLLNLGRIAERSGDDSAAEQHYARAIEVLETLRGGLAGEEHRIAFIGGVRRIEAYERLVALKLRRGQFLDAFEYAERGKARAILDRLGAGRPLWNLPATHPEIRAMLAASERPVVLIEYFLCGDRLAVFAIRADAEVQATLLDVDHAELRRFTLANFGTASRVRDLIVSGLDELWHSFDPLVAPVAEWSRPGDVVVFVPHGVMHYLPLHTLRIGGEALIRRNPVSYAPSASVLRLCRHAESDRDGRVAVFGDPRADLPHARTEAAAVAALFDLEPLLGAAVTPESFAKCAAGATLVHYAGHSSFDVDDAMASGLHLASEVLPARRIQDLPDLRPRIVTLSGCETGVNKRHPGDELIGLTRAFLSAGAATVVASLWRVADASTAHLMRVFYGRLARGDAAVDALRAAMLDVEAQPERSSIYHWAPFIIIGNWE